YVPSMLQPKLKTLAYNPLDGANPYKHDYFVDGQINIGSINGGSTVALFGSLGAGGQGLYALDISTLTASSDADVAAKALWEITPSSIKYNNAKTSTSSYGNLGYTYGTPQIVKLNIGGSATDALIIGNGYNTSGISSLFVINAATGARIAEIVTPTTSSGANGIFEAKALDANNDGYVDRVYAGDLNGKVWRFDLSSTSSGSWSVTALFTTANNLPITSTPGVVKHPNGGYMVDFGTGSTLSGSYGTYNHSTNAWTVNGTGDMATASPATYYVYGIWDKGGSTAVVDTDLVLQTLEERAYAASAASTVTTRVRRASANAIDWSSKKGWKVALPAGERVVGEGSFLENGRFYFNSYNPTVAPKLIDGTTTDIYGENWLMELNALTGGSSSAPFLDLNGDQLLNDSDRIKYVSGDTKPSGASDGDPITLPNEKGIPVGKFIATGVQSQPLLVELQKLNTTFMNQNPDVIYPAASSVDRGVAGGHFDVDYFYPPAGNCNNLAGSAGSKAVGSIKFTYASGSKKATVNALKITAPNGEVIYNGSPGSIAPNTLDDTLNGVSSASYTLSKNGGGDAATVLVTAISPGTAYNGAITVLMSVGGSVSTRYTITALAGGTNA
ncbi:MAG: hypothetical protein HXX19_20145, partial [Rhodoferax sp.]|nr:hypothetical protein [Rhodoferax sp.]